MTELIRNPLQRATTSCLLLLCGILSTSQPLRGEESWQVGFAKVDITPTAPLRLSGYSTRSESHTGVADPLSARAMVITPLDKTATDSAAPAALNTSLVLVSVDSIAVSSVMTVELANWLEAKHSVPRSQLAVCSTHSHAAPHIAGALQNLFREPSTPAQVAATKDYTAHMAQALRQVIDAAMADRHAASLSISNTTADFAINRRVLSQGTWTGFGEQLDGPVDRRVRLLVARNATGELLGGAFMYACHCTTLGGDFNQISGDWAGLTASRLEQRHPAATFVAVIGCGADANPNPRGSYDLAQQHTAELVSAIENQLKNPNWEPLVARPVAHFGYAGLVPEQPTSQLLEERANSEQPNERRWAEHMLAVKKEMGRLPETYPMPIHTWQFGDQLTWVFLGGEVVVDYQLQIEKELPTQQTWVAAYTDDVFAYVASERMRSEGGYEVDFSMMFYLQPGRWESGTQSLIARRTREIFGEEHPDDRPLTAAQALAALRVPDGYAVELVAAEPLVQDPINIAFGPDGRVWVVEMADYPRGTAGGGRVKWLRDNDGDGDLDEAHVFLSELSYPTSVMPYGNGVLIIAAPNIILATDSDDDGAADKTEVLITGIHAANPQHRASGFEIGLDGWLHFSAGEGTRELVSHRNAQTLEVHNRDVAWNVRTGELRTTAGETQFVRARDAFGNWFGNSNSYPIYQYPIEDRYVHQSSIPGGTRQHLLTPAVAPPVLPRSRTADRFNDLFALNRFTSACSSIVLRVPQLVDPQLAGDDRQEGFICEPVHNLVARIEMRRSGSAFSANRHPQDIQYDFLTSTDPWSRPVRVVNAPDGSLWVVDMVRRVIEHPEWIPTAWQERLDLRSGAELGRIYRIFRRDHPPSHLPRAGVGNSLVEKLADPNGAVRDLALLDLITTKDSELSEAEATDLQTNIRQLARGHDQAAVRVSALGCLAAMSWMTEADVRAGLQDKDPRVVRWALELCESLPQPTRELAFDINAVSDRDVGGFVDLQWVLTVSAMPQLATQIGNQGLATIAARSRGDEWITKALSLVQQPEQALAVARGMLQAWGTAEQVSPSVFAAVEDCVVQLWKKSPVSERNRFAEEQLRLLLAATTSNPGSGNLTPNQLLLLAVLAKTASPESSPLSQLLSQATAQSLQRLEDSSTPETQQLTLVNLLGCGLTSPSDDLRLAKKLIEGKTSESVQRASIESLRRLADPEVAELLLELWPDLNSSLRSAAGATILARRDWARSLVLALETGTVRPNQLDLATLQQLRSYGDRDLRNRCLELFGKPSERSHVVARYLAELPAPIANTAGQKLFVEHCGACHQAASGKSTLGPPLENLQHWTLDQWLTAILDPNQAVEPKYRQSTVLTTDGQIVAGILIDQNPQELQLAVSDGSVKSLPTSEVETIKLSGISLMPEGFEEKLTPQQLSELLGYLRNR